MTRSRLRPILLCLLIPLVVTILALTIGPAYSSTPGLVPEQQAYFKASNMGGSDYFGYSVAISGDTMVVGAILEDSAATGVGGDQGDNSHSDSGAVYVFTRSGGLWTQQAYLKASNTDVGDYFGYSVAISGDTVVVGAYGEDSNAVGVNGDQSDNSATDSGAVYVFTRSGSTWTQQAYLKASNTGGSDHFGHSVAISGDTMVVGALMEDSNATGVGGDQGDNSAASAGAAYVFTRSGSTWTQAAYLKASNTYDSDFFGYSVAIAGDTVVVGADSEDSNATGIGGDQSDNTATDAGAAYVFTRSGTTWSQQAYLKASNTDANDRFGYSVAISGSTVVVAAYAEDSNTTGVGGDESDNSAMDSGAAYVFRRSGSTWAQEAYLKASNTGAWDYFGYAVAISGDTVVVGAGYEESNATGVNGDQSDNSAFDAGAGYTFTRSGSTWTQADYLKASNTDAEDYFGQAVAVSGGTVVVGAQWEDSNATGVNGNQSDNTGTNSGAAYAFATATATRYQQTDAKLTYLGSWSYAATWSASGGSFNYTSTAGSAVIVNFTGTWIQLRGVIAPWYGKASVSLDGETPEIVDFYNPSVVLYKQPIYQQTGLDWEPHTLVIKCLHEKNTSSSGYSINLDAVDVGGVLTQAPVAERHQQDATSDFKYAGVWSTSSTWSASGGSFAYADSPGASVNVAFDGTYLAWYATKGPGYGKAQVSLDGGSPFYVDLYSGSTLYKQRVYNTGLLEDATHTLSIYWVGQKNAAAWGTKIDVDAFDLLGSHMGATKAPAILWRYQQSDSRLTYLGAWTTAITWSASGGTFSSTGSTGAAVLVSFAGSSVKLLARTAPWYGKARVCLDGDWSTAELVDFYSAGSLYKQTVYEKTGLSDDLHTLAIKCVGEKNTSSGGFSINVDALDITGYLAQAPVPTRYQEDNVAFTYGGTWTPVATWSASGGSYKSANILGAQVTVNFTGSYLAWYAKTAPWYGKATVTLDGVPVTPVDLYSTSTLYKQRVYNTGLLTDTTHTLVIQWSGTKRAASAGTSINVDTFDILGSL